MKNSGGEDISMIKLDEKAVKETLKKIIDNNNTIPNKAKVEIKAIIEMEHDPEKLLQECLIYMLLYQE